MKANDQLQKWFVDDDALERAINGEYVDGPIHEYHPLNISYLNVDHVTVASFLLA